SFAYAEKPVLEHVSLQIPRASTVAFVGESGSGKSTLVDLLMGVLRPQRGQIVIDGQSLSELDIESYRRAIGYVPQDCLLYDDSLATNISLWSADPAAPTAQAQIRAALKRAHLLDWVDAQPAGILTEIGDRGVRMSGGQKQRLSIAREL